MNDPLFDSFKVPAKDNPARSLHGFVLQDGGNGSHLGQRNQRNRETRVDRIPCLAILEELTQTAPQPAALLLRRAVDECEEYVAPAIVLRCREGTLSGRDCGRFCRENFHTFMAWGTPAQHAA